MKSQGKKILVGLSLVLMVLSIIPSGALANETGTASKESKMLSPEAHFRCKGPMGPGHGIEKPEKPVFETEEEELEFVREKTIAAIEKRIERLENFDGSEDGKISSEAIEEKITELETLLEEVNNASTLDKLKEATADMKRPGHRLEKPEKPEFETEEEEIEFVKEKAAKSIDRMIEMFENIDLEDSGELTSDDIESMISQLEDIKAGLDDEDLTLDDLGEMKESIFQIVGTSREVMPAPANHGERGPHHRAPMTETEEL